MYGQINGFLNEIEFQKKYQSKLVDEYTSWIDLGLRPE